MIPESTLGGLERYIAEGCPTGGFLEAVLENDMLGAYQRADEFNTAAMGEIVKWLYNNAPGDCWGSRKRVAAWYKQHQERRAAAEAVKKEGE